VLIVGANDYAVIELNQAALAELRCEKRLAREWFEHHLAPAESAVKRTE
jgi:hypothetical protein